MKENVTFLKCEICGNVIGLIEGDSDRIKCCNQNMNVIEANVSDGASEKHIPTYEVCEDEICVRVGSEEHPMEKGHYIMWVAEVSENQTTRVKLYPEQGVEVRFKYIPGATLYAYCNRHGLWKTVVE